MLSGKHGLFIPIHRMIPKNVINSALEEIEYAQKKFGLKIPLILFDDSKIKEISLSNLNLFKSLMNDKKIPYFYITRAIQNLIAQKISSALNININLLYDNTKAYGKMFNMLFLVGLILKIENFHRRDSDVFVAEYMNKKLYPIDQEIHYMDKTFNNVLVSIVGSNYYGEPNIRLDDCMKNNHFLREYVLSWGTDENNEEVIQKFISDMHSKVPFCNEDNVSLSTLKTFDYVDGGNVSFSKRLYQMAPNSPNSNLTGTDYYLFTLSQAINMGMVVHNRRLIHDHMEEAVTLNDYIEYWDGIYYNSDSTNVYFKAFRDMNDKYDKGKFENTDYKAVRMEFINSLREAYLSPKEDRIRCLDHLSTALYSTNMTHYMIIVDGFKKNNYQKIFHQIEVNVEEYISLIESWEDIITYVESNRSELFTLINKELIHNL